MVQSVSIKDIDDTFISVECKTKKYHTILCPKNLTFANLESNDMVLEGVPRSIFVPRLSAGNPLEMSVLDGPLNLGRTNYPTS